MVGIPWVRYKKALPGPMSPTVSTSRVHGSDRKVSGEHVQINRKDTVLPPDTNSLRVILGPVPQQTLKSRPTPFTSHSQRQGLPGGRLATQFQRSVVVGGEGGKNQPKGVRRQTKRGRLFSVSLMYRGSLTSFV